MPGKHVHFDDVTSPVVPYLVVPSLASSSSSASSSPEPTTPPPLGFGSPYNTAPLPGNASAHPLFRESGFTHLYSFDISKHPSSMDFNNIPRYMWDQPASVPGMPSMTFICERLPWTFTIVPASGTGIVTVRDLFEGLYTALRKSVSAAEFQALSISEQTEVTSAYSARCKYFFDAPDIYEQELNKGVKRVDFLGKHSYLAGIEFLKTKGGRWQLFTRKKS